MKSSRCPTGQWNLLLDPGTSCYLKLKGRYTFEDAAIKCAEKHSKAKPALPKNDRENELLVEMLGNAKGVWLYAERKRNAIHGIRLISNRLD